MKILRVILNSGFVLDTDCGEVYEETTYGIMVRTTGGEFFLPNKEVVLFPWQRIAEVHYEDSSETEETLTSSQDIREQLMNAHHDDRLHGMCSHGELRGECNRGGYNA
jgi:hypothetical protein